MKRMGATRLRLKPWERLFTRRLPKRGPMPPVIDRAWDRMIERRQRDRKNATSCAA